MNTLVIACNKPDYTKLKQHKLLESIKKSFGADNIIWCDSADCLKSLSQKVDYILYFNSFEVPYYKVDEMAKASMSVDKIIGAIFENNKLWIYDSDTVANCIDSDGSAFINAIDRVMDVSSWVPKVCNLGLVITILVLLTAAILAGISGQKTYNAYADQAQQVEEQQPDVRYSITGMIIDK